MLGPTKWRLLTIVAGILLAHAIDSPSRSPRVLQSTQSAGGGGGGHLGITIQRIVPWNRDARSTDVRTARNLYTPYKRFSNVDNVRFIERRQGATDWNWKTTFGAFRYAPHAIDMRRRSDDPLAQVTIFEVANSTAAQPLGLPEVAALTASTARPAPLQSLRRPKYKYIPLQPTQTAADDFGQGVDRSVDTNLYRPHGNANKIAFPGSVGAPVSSALTATALAAQVASSEDDIQGRRSGIQFTAQSPNFGSLFMPQGYQEDNPSHPNFQSPYNEELSPQTDGTETRTTRGATFETAPPQRTAITFPVSNVKQFRDDVTKFGDANGPITVQRQFSDFLDKQGLRTYENIYYQDDYRHPRHYFPPKSFVEYSEYPGPPTRSRLIVPWKSSRTPRVVFPQGDGFPSSTGVSNYNSNDIVFRYAYFWFCFGVGTM